MAICNTLCRKCLCHSYTFLRVGMASAFAPQGNQAPYYLHEAQNLRVHRAYERVYAIEKVDDEKAGRVIERVKEKR